MNDAAYILTKAAIAYKNGEEFAPTFQKAIDTIFWDWAGMKGQCPETQEVYCALSQVGLTPIR